MTAATLILASSSIGRRSLLDRLGIPYTAISPDIDETQLPDEDVQSMVLRLAEEKAKKIATQYPEAIIIGADQVGTLDDIILCKPITDAKAKEQLRQVSDRMVRFYTALCVLDAKSGTWQSAIEIYDVYFRPLTEATIENYLRKEQALHCAGSFQAEGLGIALIHQFAGDDYTALIGLPLIRLTEMLRSVGIDVLF